MRLRTHFDKITLIRVKVELVWHKSLKFTFGNNYIQTLREGGCVLTWNSINHTNESYKIMTIRDEA